MNKIEIEVPEGKRAAWVNGVLTLVDEPKKYYQFKVGDKAILNKDVCFIQVSGDYVIVNAGTEVEILEVFNRADTTETMYKVKHQHSTAMVLGQKLDKIDYRFKVGDIAILKNYTGFKHFKQEDGVCLISAGAEVEIMSVSDCINNISDKLYEVKYQNATTVVKGCDLIPIEPKPVEYKFNIGDKVKLDNGETYVITCQFVINGEPFYNLKNKRGEMQMAEKLLTPIPKSITERIKSFKDAIKWCRENNHNGLVDQYYDAINVWFQRAKDITAYLQLRIITCALNEGWEPTFTEDEERYHIIYDVENDRYDFGCSLKWETAPNKLIFKSERLAEYAATQFKDIYADFCGRKKGGEG